jgi:hypothetical protein
MRTIAGTPAIYLIAAASLAQVRPVHRERGEV